MLDRIFDYFKFVKEWEFKIIFAALIIGALIGGLYLLTKFIGDLVQSRREGKNKMIQELKRELEAERKERAELQRRMDEQYARLTILMDDQRKEMAALEKTEAEEV